MFYAHIPIGVLVPLHILAACLSVWRITALFTEDKITEPIRKRFPWYVLKCPICFSMWASFAAVAMFAFFPWANWLFALAMVYRWRIESVVKKRIESRGRVFSCEIHPNGSWAVTTADLQRIEVEAILNAIDRATVRPATPEQPAQPTEAQVKEALQSLSPPQG